MVLIRPCDRPVVPTAAGAKSRPGLELLIPSDSYVNRVTHKLSNGTERHRDGHRRGRDRAPSDPPGWLWMYGGLGTPLGRARRGVGEPGSLWHSVGDCPGFPLGLLTTTGAPDTSACDHRSRVAVRRPRILCSSRTSAAPPGNGSRVCAAVRGGVPRSCQGRLWPRPTPDSCLGWRPVRTVRSKPVRICGGPDLSLLERRRGDATLPVPDEGTARGTSCYIHSRPRWIGVFASPYRVNPTPDRWRPLVARPLSGSNGRISRAQDSTRMAW
jgi:hypothetical protein